MIPVLTVRNPWAWALIHAGKTVENRTRSLGAYRGPVLIHAGKTYDDAGSVDSRPMLDAMNAWLDQHGHAPLGDAPWDVRGAIVGVVDLVETHHADWCWDGPRVHCSPWGESDVHHLVMANPRQLDEPIPWKGALGLRKTRFDIAGHWLVEATDLCTCGPGPLSPHHEPGCGLEPVALLSSTTERAVRA
ncbi:hypothetical protein [Microbacterium sp. NPDC058389]|uniref:hypothetical protein n=1 Tax=Microbacterium sp. NPDC058389 TaxID=3346475 RepID=UPI003656595D